MVQEGPIPYRGEEFPSLSTLSLAHGSSIFSKESVSEWITSIAAQGGEEEEHHKDEDPVLGGGAVAAVRPIAHLVSEWTSH